MVDEINKSVLTDVIGFFADSSSKGEKIIGWESYKVISVYGLKKFLSRLGYDVSDFDENLKEFLKDNLTVMRDENNFGDILYKKPIIPQQDL